MSNIITIDSIYFFLIQFVKRVIICCHKFFEQFFFFNTKKYVPDRVWV